MKLETVKIKCGDDYAVINECDFIEGEHELFDEAPTPKEGTVDWLKAELTANGVEIPEGAKKADLEDLYAGLDSAE